MKRTAIMFFSAALLLSLIACGAADGKQDFISDEVLQQYDHNPSWTHVVASFCKTDSVAYFNSSMMTSQRPYIAYIDLESGTSGPLCGKPECNHSEETCNAYLYNSMAEGLCCYDGRIYWAAQDAEGCHVFSSALDGTDRRTILDLNDRMFLKPVSNRYVMFHRGYLYLCGGTSQLSDGIPSFGSFAYAVPLNGNGMGTVILDNMNFDPELGVNCFMQAYRTSLYLMEITWKNDTYTLTLYRWSIIDQELETLFDDEVCFVANEFWIMEDGILISDRLSGNIYRYDFESNEINWLFDINEGVGEYDLLKFSDGVIAGWVLDDNHTPMIRAANFMGKIIFDETVDIPEYQKYGCGAIFCGADSGNLYYYLHYNDSMSDSASTYGKLVEVPMDGNEPRVLWSNEGNF